LEEVMETIGFVGLGRMGGAMAQRLVAAGQRVIGVDTSTEARRKAASAGIMTSDDLHALDNTPIVLSSLPGTAEVEEVYLNHLLVNHEPGALFLDMSTIDVAASQRIAAEGLKRSHRFLDCPVSGTSLHARQGSLVVMAGGDPEALNRAGPFLSSFSKAVHHLGDNGAGLEMKLITNRLLTTHLVAIAEAILEMEGANLDPERGLALLAEGAVPRLLDYKALPMARRDHNPQFTVELMHKDLRLAVERSDPGPTGKASAAVLARALEDGWGAQDISAVIEVLASTRPERLPSDIHRRPTTS
jgi:3-hydroxyisobutyrate dehydrogenase-like beta-hydroxyacid dehydrogenase